MVLLIIQLAAILILPFLVKRLEKRSRIIRWVSPIIICYLIGIGAANIPGLGIHRDLMDAGSSLSVLLAIPLLLFSAHFSIMLRLVRPALFAFTLGVVAVVLCSLCAFWIFGDQIQDPEAVTGMMIGVYTGGTPNMSAIGLALGVEEEVFILLNSADIVFSGLYFIFLLSAGKYLLGWILPPFTGPRQTEKEADNDPETDSGSPNIRQVMAGLGLSVLVVALAFGFSRVMLREWSVERATPMIILGITTLGIAASFHPRIRCLPGTFASAEYLLLVFALAMGSMADFSELLASSSRLFLFCGCVVLGSVLVQLLLAFLFRIDRDTLMIASTAAIFGPAFIGPVAQTIGNRAMIGIGVALGLIGFAIGNYLGLGIAFLIHA